MIPSFGAFYEARLYKRIENTLEYEETYTIFKCKIASNKDMRSYQVLNGLFNENYTLSLEIRDRDIDIKPNDKVFFMNEMKVVSSVGVFLNRNRMMAQSKFDDDYVIANSPKGITLQ